MKQKKMLSTTGPNGVSEASASWDSPIRTDAFDIDEGEKIERIAHHFSAIMRLLGLDLTDDSLKDTPNRVAKMYVKEAFSGLDPKNKPVVRFFKNTYRYDQMVIEKNITLHSYCEHHFVPIYGKAHVAYLPQHGKVMGLSKINRIVHYYAKRPQVQERLTVQIGKAMSQALGAEDVAVVIDAHHMCVTARGVGDSNTKTVTTYFSGLFLQEEKKQELFRSLAGS